MRVIVLIACAGVAAAVFATMLLSLWSTRAVSEGEHQLRQSRVVEVVWAMIPCLVVAAAAVPAAIAILTHSAD